MPVFPTGAQTKTGAERRRVATNHDRNYANYMEIIRIQRRRAGQPVDEPTVAAAAQALYEADLNEAGKGT